MGRKQLLHNCSLFQFLAVEFDGDLVWWSLLEQFGQNTRVNE